MNISEYMTQCLLHPEHGYYTTGQPLGAKGDFVTAPEISQMFGELIGLSMAQAWIDQGCPAPFCLAEIGPGRGVLMADILRATRNVPNFHSAMKLVLVDVSPTMRVTQENALSGYTVDWVNGVDKLPNIPLFLIANEFFDCLPIRQFKHTEAGWQEQMVWAQDGQLQFVLGKEAPDQIFPERAIGSFIETSSSSAAIAQAIAIHISEHSGAAFIIDYGDWGSEGDTLQAVKDHQKVSPLKFVGDADLTAHVNFQTLAEAIRPHATCSTMVTQGVFLERLGITARAQALAQKLSGSALENHIQAHKRLTHPEEMGSLFKAISITQNGHKLPAGFE